MCFNRVRVRLAKASEGPEPEVDDLVVVPVSGVEVVVGRRVVPVGGMYEGQAGTVENVTPWGSVRIRFAKSGVVSVARDTPLHASLGL